MNIAPINSTNSQPNFNGYVDKSIIRIVNKATIGSLRENYKNYTRSGTPVNEKALKKIVDNSKNILEKLNEYMSKFHKDTYLTYDYDNSFILKNKKLKGASYSLAKVFEGYHHKSIFSESGPLDFKNLGNGILYSIESFVRGLNPDRAEQIDKYMFEKFARSATDTFFPMRNARKADKLAKEFKAETGWVEKTREVLEKRKQDKLAQKEIKIKNKEIYKTAKKGFGN